ncbi:MAG: hemolysin III family protein [Oscillospiraceae bacterium]|nr:hemolysin III family protein [Oscillospiraceae bacterium]
MARTKLCDRELPPYTRGEEIFNMVSHIVGGGFAVIALVLCVLLPALKSNTAGVLCGAVFGISLVTLYTISGIYHGLKGCTTAKKVMQVIDHCAIFLLIAGTYTPITLLAVAKVSPTAAWIIFGIVWACAALGITLNAIDLKKYRVFSMITYIGMGWCISAALRPFAASVEPGAVWLLVAGGISYTAGAVFYSFGKKKRYMHSIFHLFVLAGSILHFFSIALYIL